MPESPRWLIEVGRDEEAIRSIQLLRGDAVDARAEVAEIRAAYEAEKALYSGVEWGQLFKGTNARRTLISIGLQCLQQGQGISFMANFLASSLLSITSWRPRRKRRNLADLTSSPPPPSIPEHSTLLYLTCHSLDVLHLTR